jgi:predicted RNA polymerase sigma factor
MSIPSQGDEARRTAEAVARRSYGKLVAYLAARTRDVAAAEDALSEAFAAALSTWPQSGCPANPEAWLMTVARRKIIDMVRKRLHDEPMELHEFAEELSATQEQSTIPDRRLALMFTCAHPAIEAGIRSPLILQVVLGLDARAIASAFLTSPAAMGKRLVRAKDKIRQAGIPFHVPEREELVTRLETVLDAIYAAFTDGWADAAGTDAERRDLAEETIFLARLVAELLPNEPEALGLLALILHAEARRGARRSASGEFIPLAEQNPALWDEARMREAEALLWRASGMSRIGRYQLEAALQSAHVYRCRAGEANWADVVQLYDVLLALTGSPVVAINRSLALAEVQGAAAGLETMPDAVADPRLLEYQPYWAARAELLARTESYSEARHAYEMAIGLERDDAVRRFLHRRLAMLGDGLKTEPSSRDSV